MMPDVMQTTRIQDSLTASVFTNAQDQVVFVDLSFLNMLNYPDTGAVAGNSLSQGLGLDKKTAKQLLDELKKLGSVKNHALVLKGVGGVQLDVTCNAVATYDPEGHYIGADITLNRQRKAGESQEAAISTQVRSALARSHSPEETAFVQLYFTTHLKAIYVLMSRLLGLWVRDNLDRIINDASKQNGWPVKIKNGLFVTDLSESSVLVYRGLLAPTVDYAINMIGQRVVSKEVQKTDNQLHPGLLKLAEKAGLRELLPEHL